MFSLSSSLKPFTYQNVNSLGPSIANTSHRTLNFTSQGLVSSLSPMIKATNLGPLGRGSFKGGSALPIANVEKKSKSAVFFDFAEIFSGLKNDFKMFWQKTTKASSFIKQAAVWSAHWKNTVLIATAVALPILGYRIYSLRQANLALVQENLALVQENLALVQEVENLEFKVSLEGYSILKDTNIVSKEIFVLKAFFFLFAALAIYLTIVNRLEIHNWKAGYNDLFSAAQELLRLTREKEDATNEFIKNLKAKLNELKAGIGDDGIETIRKELMELLDAFNPTPKDDNQEETRREVNIVPYIPTDL